MKFMLDMGPVFGVLLGHTIGVVGIFIYLMIQDYREDKKSRLYLENLYAQARRSRESMVLLANQKK
jgi:hypothetical protein